MQFIKNLIAAAKKIRIPDDPFEILEHGMTLGLWGRLLFPLLLIAAELLCKGKAVDPMLLVLFFGQLAVVALINKFPEVLFPFVMFFAPSNIRKDSEYCKMLRESLPTDGQKDS